MTNCLFCKYLFRFIQNRFPKIDTDGNCFFKLYHTKIFEAKLTSVLDEEIKSTVTEEQIRNKEVNEKHKEIQRFIQFICNIVCGYDEDNNIRNDSISFSLLKKKISSNLQNFANYSADGKKENINNKNNEMIS